MYPKNWIRRNLQKPKMNTRYYDISLLRVVAMLLVVYYHCICPYYMWRNGIASAGVVIPLYQRLSVGLSMVHLPVFFAVAGYLFGYKRVGGGYTDQRRFLMDKAKRVLVPYFTVGLLMIGLRQGRLIGLIAGGVGHLWFLMTLFECYAVGKLIDFVLAERIRVKVAALFFTALCWALSTFWPFVLGHDFPHYFFFYLGGMLLGTLDIDRLRKWRMLFVMIVVVSLAVMVLEATLGSRRLLAWPGSIALVFFVLLAFRTSHIGDVPRWVKSLDVCSMGIYIVHHIVIQAMDRTDLLRPLLQTHYYMYPSVQFVLVLLFSWGLVWTLRRYSFARYFGL